MKPRTSSEYLARLDPEQRAALTRVRSAILAAAPGVEECIRYGLPAFRFEGQIMVCLRAAARHCALHPMSGSVVAEHRQELAGYETSPSTVRFPASAPLPAKLVRMIVRARIVEIRAEAHRRAVTAVRTRASRRN